MKEHRSGNILRTLLAIALSVASGVLLLRDVDWARLSAVLDQVNLAGLAVAVLMSVASFVLRAARWQSLFALSHAPTLRRSFAVLSIGFLVNVLAPTRLGEIVRAYLICKSGSTSMPYALGTLGIEKFTEVTVILFSVGLLATQMILPDWLTLPTQVALVGVIAFFLFLLLIWQGTWFLRMVGFLGRLVPFVSKEWLYIQAQQALASLNTLRRGDVLARLLSWSALAWLFAILTNNLVLWSIGQSLPLWSGLVILVVTQVGTAVVPSAPGQLGVFDYLAVLSLSVFTVTKENALAYAVLLHLVVYIPMMLIGAGYLWQEKITWDKLTQSVRTIAKGMS